MIENILFAIAFGGGLLVFLYLFLTKKGQTSLIQQLFKVDTVTEVAQFDSGDISRQRFFGIKWRQTTKVYRCSYHGETFFVFEITNKSFLSVSRNFLKMTNQDITLLSTLLKHE